MANGRDEHPNVFNKFAVAGQIRDDQVLLLGLPVQRAPNDPDRGFCVRPLSRDEALNLAAWLVAVSGRPRAEFLALLDAIERT
jgi:hypothetical protein